MARNRAGEEPVVPPARETVMVYPTGAAFVDGEPSIPHLVTPERAAELVGAPYPAFSIAPLDEEAVNPSPATAGPNDSEV